MNGLKPWSPAVLAAAVLCAATVPAQAKEAAVLVSPQPHVVCDYYFCADAQEGVSIAQTRQHLGEARAKALASQGSFDHGSFTFANGVFCDVKTRQCHANRYLEADGSRAPVSARYTKLLFGAR